MYNVALLILIIFCLDDTQAQNASYRDLLHLLNTTSRIYVYYTSYMMYKNNDALTCLYYLKDVLTETFFRVDLNYNRYDERFSREVTGILGNDTKGDPFMQPFSWPGPWPPMPKVLKYYDSRHHCGVFLLQVAGTMQCELHIWEGDIIKKEQYFYNIKKTCITFYNKICGGEKPTVTMYTTNCYKI
ncbi:uncharacterized protein LOC119174158 isoform X1 [Rhipicephalus microplus]|uniref:uncharacterized protein LOC119174158 isoform X1 n=1 Tax=Rhipicephalus microplus TaxID=6941 RepID=UPI001889BDA5|nr:uncharacterized protein LOC119174158 [Rhipicephalus microplus]